MSDLITTLEAVLARHQDTNLGSKAGRRQLARRLAAGMAGECLDSYIVQYSITDVDDLVEDGSAIICSQISPEIALEAAKAAIIAMAWYGDIRRECYHVHSPVPARIEDFYDKEQVFDPVACTGLWL